MQEMGPLGAKQYIFGDQFYSNNAKYPDSMYSSIYTPENISCHNFTWGGTNSQEILNLVAL